MKHFVSHDPGFAELLSGLLGGFPTQPLTAVLVLDGHLPDRNDETELADIVADECQDADYTRQLVTVKTAAVAGTRVRFSHAKTIFTADAPDGKGSITARYIYYISGDLDGVNSIIGHVDMGDSTSTNGEFSYTPSASGLFEIARTELEV